MSSASRASCDSKVWLASYSATRSWKILAMALGMADVW